MSNINVYLNIFDIPCFAHGRLNKKKILQIFEDIFNPNGQQVFNTIQWQNSKFENKREIVIANGITIYLNISLSYIQLNNIDIDTINYVLFDRIDVEAIEFMAHMIEKKYKLNFYNNNHRDLPEFFLFFIHHRYRSNVRLLLLNNQFFVMHDPTQKDNVNFQLKIVYNKCFENPAFRWTSLLPTSTLLAHFYELEHYMRLSNTLNQITSNFANDYKTLRELVDRILKYNDNQTACPQPLIIRRFNNLYYFSNYVFYGKEINKNQLIIL